MKQLFTVVDTAYDPKNKPVHLCQGKDEKFYVYKPSSGFKSKSFDKKDDEETLLAIFERQRHDAHTFASYLPGEQEEPADKKKSKGHPVTVTPAAVPSPPAGGKGKGEAGHPVTVSVTSNQQPGTSV